MIIEFPISSMESDDLITTSDRLFNVTSEAHRTILANRLQPLKGASDDLAKALNKNNKSGYTPLLVEADKDRDDAYRCMKFGVLSATYNKDETIRAAGKRLLTVLKSHNTTLYNLSYVSQTAEMKSLKLDLDEMTDDLATVGLATEFQDMKDTMVAFEILHTAKTKEKSNSNLPLVAESKQQLSRQLILLLRQVEILEEDKVEGIEALVNDYNETISTIMSAVRARKTRGQRPDSQDGESEDSLS
ncbi:MAG: DUF6261 family protein [Cyclobacteriaceae bacterium]